jgi:hypothetical protein
VTPRVTNHLTNPDHIPKNTNDSKEIKFQMKRLKFKLRSLLIHVRIVILP